MLILLDGTGAGTGEVAGDFAHEGQMTGFNRDSFQPGSFPDEDIAARAGCSSIGSAVNGNVIQIDVCGAVVAFGGKGGFRNEGNSSAFKTDDGFLRDICFGGIPYSGEGLHKRCLWHRIGNAPLAGRSLRFSGNRMECR